MRRILPALAAAVLGCGCGAARPMPTLEDYSHGVSAAIRGIGEYFFEKGMREGASAPVALGNGEGSAALAEFSRRWRSSCAADCGSATRIVDLQRKSSSAVSLRLEVRLEGLAATGGDERVAALAFFDLEFARARGATGWTLRASKAAGGPAPMQRGRPHLFEEAALRGLVSRHEPLDPAEKTNLCIPATHHQGGVLLVDADGDGSLDVIIPSLRTRLFLNDGTGRFRDATAGSGLDLLPEQEASGGVAADVDGDGLPDLFLSNHVSPSRMLRNLGRGRFRDVTDSWGLAGLSAPSTSAVFFDADGDGRVDLFVARYGDARRTGPAYDGLNGVGDRLFRNVDRGGRPFFVDETSASGLGDAGWGLAVSACDVDGDGRSDLYVANDFGRNSLYENRSTPGRPRFANVAEAAGVEDDGYGMGVAWGDFDGDGRWDLHVSDYWTPYRWILRDARWPLPAIPGVSLARPFMARMMTRRSRGDGLFRNLGGMRFERVSESAGVADGGWAWGTEFVDLDGKGREDLVVVNGMFRATTGKDDEIAFWNAMGRDGVNFHDGVWGGIDFGADGTASRTPKRLFWNRGDGTFEERAYVEGFDTRDDTRGLAYGDLDGDGAPEVVVSCFRGPVLVYANNWKADGGGRLVLSLSVPSGFNRDAIGAVARLHAGGRVQLREVRAGSSYLSQSSRDLLFGLGASGKADRIEIRWPDGKTQELRDVPAGTRVTLVEGGEEKRELLRK